MIRLPKGKVLQKNLDTHYVRLEGVMQTLNQESFTGYVRTVFEADEGITFFRDGDLVDCVFELKGQTLFGTEAVTELLKHLKNGKAFVDVCKIDYDLLTAMLALVHGSQHGFTGGESPKNGQECLKLLQKYELTGALTAETADGPVFAFCSGGELLGWYYPDTDEWKKPEETAPAVNSAWQVWDSHDAAVERTVDLGKQKESSMQGLLQVLKKRLPYFGPHVFSVEYKKRGIKDARKMTKEEFRTFALGLVARCRLLIGDKKANAVGAELFDHVSHILDLGI